MRYLDWDVLLFPGHQNSSHVPLKEFKTACYAEHYENAPNMTPLLTTFVPTLPAGKPFQISLHSWSDTGPMLTLSNNILEAARPKELWQVRVVIDGICVCTETFDIDATWPQIVSSTASKVNGEVVDPLRFPPFHRDIMSQAYWEASDQVGRIRVELSTGYMDSKSSQFVKVVNLVNFAFQPAPMDLLEHSGIAWPNPRLLRNPLASNNHFAAPPMLGAVAMPKKHKKAMSATTNFVVPPTALMVPPAQQPLNPFTQDQHSNYDASSRSSSAYSNVSTSAAPLLPQMPTIPPYLGTFADSARNKQQQFAWRLPSDQLQQILNAIHPAPAGGTGTNASASMPPPPPPPPAHAPAPRPQAQSQLPAIPSARPPLGPDIVNFIDRRAESRYSDVSMHAGCNGFPMCTTEDEEGSILHVAPNGPASIVRGRKEGSSPAKPRDFFNTILDAKASIPTSAPVVTPSKEAGLPSSSPADSRKRTRSALRSLNINDGSPEKNVAPRPRKASKASVSSSKSDKENNEEASGTEESMVL